jgi:hypothetical protein
MRWFVEVSRVGESSTAEKYCVEAKQWQAALQDARKQRGDSGALSQFSIELLDDGYRAIDPSLKLRYMITHAPDDAALNDGSSATSIASASITPAASNPGAVPRLGSLIPRPVALTPRASTAPRSQQLLVPDDPVPPPPASFGAPASGTTGLPSTPTSVSLPRFELVRERVEEPRPDSPITYRELAFAVAPGATQAQVEALLYDRYQATRATIEDRPPGKFVQLAVFDHVFKRKPERGPLGTFAWKDWRGSPIVAFPGFGEAAMAPMSQVPPAPASVPPSNGSHASMPPALEPGANLSLLPLSAQLGSSAPPSSAPGSGSLTPLPIVSLNAPVAVPASIVPPAAVEARAEPGGADVVVESKAELELAAPVAPESVSLAVESAPLAAEVPASAESIATAESALAREAPVPPLAAPVVDAAPAPAPVSAPGFELHFESEPLKAAPVEPVRQSSPGKERVSRPRQALGRRRAGEDLIGELFEFMHELHFQRDYAAGAEFVLSVLDEVLPCEGVLIHVFDINTGHFVVVRAKGPNASAVLLQRLPDQDSFVQSVMRSPRSVSVPDASKNARFNGPRWQALGVAPKAALCGAVQQGGRYLGLIELVNPLGETPFHPSELNALDYICGQFAEFLSKKPLVLAADVVLARV